MLELRIGHARATIREPHATWAILVAMMVPAALVVLWLA